MRPTLIILPLLLIALPLVGRPGHERKYLPLQAPAAQAPAAQAPAAEAPKSGLKALDFGPLSYYEGACARCHGENGANYGDLLKGKSDAQLHDGIHMMAVGPGQSPLDEPQLQVMTAWHRALLSGEPFVHLRKIERGDKIVLSGEATSDAKVIMKSGETSFEATREGSGWKIEAPSDVNLEAAELSASVEKTGTK